MKRILSTALATLFIVGAATGCSTKTADNNLTGKTAGYDNMALTQTNRTAREFNGIHDGSYVADKNGHVITDRNYRTWTDDLKIAGRDVGYGVERTAEDIGYGVKRFSHDVKDGMEDIADSLTGRSRT